MVGSWRQSTRTVVRLRLYGYEPAAPPPDVQAYRLMAAGRFAEALPLAEAAVRGQQVCLPTHGMLATILMHLGRRDDAERVIEQALQYEEGSAEAYNALAHVSLLLGATRTFQRAVSTRCDAGAR